MPDETQFDYAVVRVVPRVDRDEFVNAGVILFSPQKRFLAAQTYLDESRLAALWPGMDIDSVRRHLETIPRIAAGDADAGPIARLSLSERFHWLTSPRSTVIQISPVRTGISAEPEKLLDHLTRELVMLESP
ncbi:MAG: DUF3037 domain-containing protein, partial [Acidobacteriota bacterium]